MIVEGRKRFQKKKFEDINWEKIIKKYLRIGESANNKEEIIEMLMEIACHKDYDKFIEEIELNESTNCFESKKFNNQRCANYTNRIEFHFFYLNFRFILISDTKLKIKPDANDQVK